MAIPALGGDEPRRLPGSGPAGAGRSLRLVPAGSIGRQPRGRQPAPSPQPGAPQVAARIAQVIAEVLTGARPAAQVSDLASPDVVRLLVRSAGRLAAQRGAPRQRPIVGSVHVRPLRDGVVEACAVINLGIRYRAIALRLEASNDRWRCTALHVG
jgi:hypothetical protein